MKTARFGCLSFSGFISMLVTLVLIGGIGILQGGVLFSPGDLNAQVSDQPLGGVRSHAEITRCAGCHTAPWESIKLADRCLTCHTDLVQDPNNFHVVMIEQSKANGCQNCHTDHRGADASITFADLSQFPHKSVGFSLQSHQKTDAGTSFACADCHGSRFIRFDQAVCKDCHEKLDTAFSQKHVDTFGENCLACHDGIDTYGHTFDHNQLAFSLTGKHIPLECSQCHAGAQSIPALQAAPQNCFGCHQNDDAHAGGFGQDCAQCHTPDGWKPAKFDHAKAVFPLTGKHQQAACQDCHLQGPNGTIYKGTPQDCFTCHQKDDSHTGKFGQECGQCHTTDGWKPATFDHTLAAFPLTGKHQQVACDDCHLAGANGLIFAGTPQDCFSCHKKDDSHNGKYGQDCGQCHTTAAWKPATFDHSKSIFPLTGAHETVECTKCHVGGVFKGTPQLCVSCHQDPIFHLGLLGTDCTACHTTTSWSPAQFNQQHPFPFNHGRAVSSCRTCHPDSLSTYTCYGSGCHGETEIANKHREEGISNFTDCLKCHPNGSGGD